MILNGYDKGPIYGATAVVCEFADTTIVVHGPMGCFAPFIEATNNAKHPVNFGSSAMSNTDIIFGGEAALVAALRTMKKTELVKERFVLASVVPVLTGANTRQIVERFGREPGTGNLVCIDCAIGGSQYDGINATLLAVARPRLVKRDRIQGRVNLIGNIGESTRWKADVDELVRLLQLTGLTVKPVAANGLLQDFEEYCQASLNVLLVPEIGLPLAQYYHGELGIPYIVPDLPVGLHATMAWLSQVTDAVGMRLDQSVEVEASRTMDSLLCVGKNALYEQKAARLSGARAAIVAQESVCYAFGRFLKEELDMVPVYYGCRTRNEGQLDATTNGVQVAYDIDRDTCHQSISRFDVDLVLGSSYERAYAKANGRAFVQIAHPNYDYANICPRPYLGFQGASNLIGDILDQSGLA